jgi:hypothetical protein
MYTSVLKDWIKSIHLPATYQATSSSHNIGNSIVIVTEMDVLVNNGTQLTAAVTTVDFLVFDSTGL